MRITINLASRPFVELRSFFLRLRILMAVLALAAIALGVWTHVLEQRLHIAKAQMGGLQNATTAAQQERTRSVARMHQPANAAVLDRAHFLNELFLRKSFSWTAVMMDLERVLPAGVQVTSIEPQPTAEGDVVIRLRVSGERDRAVQLVRNLEHSQRFLEPRLSGESTEARETGIQRPGGLQSNAVAGAPAGVQFDILANYNPLPPGEPYPKEGAGARADGAGVETSGTTTSHGRYPRYGVVLKPHRAGTASGAASQHKRVQGGAR
ncbi:MAG TPA: PilN domain-containing protein [Acidobacteriaceae bacterium]|jgi:type IV pilus assembly protein PilN|nr:PilN domain-containing protein [Acidobacteriaceae bacterium]